LRLNPASRIDTKLQALPDDLVIQSTYPWI